MAPTRLLQQLLIRHLGVKLVRTRRNPKEEPIPLTATTAARLVYFDDLVRRVAAIEGDFVECGVGWGRSLLALAVLSRVRKQDRRLFAFDSFEGFPEPSPEDEAEAHGVVKGRYATTEAAVRQHLRMSGLEDGFVERRITFSKGFFEETLPHYRGRIALLHIDADLYGSYKTCLEQLYDKVAPGGIIAFDEFGSSFYPGATQAVREFFDGREPIQRSELVDRHFVVKGASAP